MAIQPLSTTNSPATNNNTVNDAIRKLNREQTIKVFKQASGNAIITGKLPYEGGYGTLYYDTDGIPSIVIGILPDGTVGLVISKPGVDVLSLFT